MLSRGTGEVISINLDELAKGQNIYLLLCMAALHLDFTIKLLTYFYSICLCLYWFWSIELILDSSQSTSQCSAEILTDIYINEFSTGILYWNHYWFRDEIWNIGHYNFWPRAHSRGLIGLFLFLSCCSCSSTIFQFTSTYWKYDPNFFKL